MELRQLSVHSGSCSPPPHSPCYVRSGLGGPRHWQRLIRVQTESGYLYLRDAAGIILEYDLNDVPLQKSIDLLDLTTETEVEARASVLSLITQEDQDPGVPRPLSLHFGSKAARATSAVPIAQSLLDEIIQFEPMVKEAHKGPLRKLIYKLQARCRLLA